MEPAKCCRANYHRHPLIQTLRPQWLTHNSYRKFITSYCEGVQTQAVISFNGNVSSNNESFVLRAKVGELVIPDKVIRDFALVNQLDIQIRMLGYENIRPYIAYLDSAITTHWVREELQAIKRENATWVEGNRAPEFDFVDGDGRHYTLDDFKGRFVYLDIWGVGCGLLSGVQEYHSLAREVQGSRKQPCLCVPLWQLFQ